MTSADTDPAPPPGEQTSAGARGALRVITLLWLAAAVLVILTGSPFAKVGLGLVMLTTLYGFSNGGIRTGALLLALMISATAAFPLGRLLEGTVGDLFNLSGLARRGASIGVTALLVLIVASLLGDLVARRVAKKHLWGEGIDRTAGAIFGLCEGALLAAMLIWGAGALEPTAQDRLERHEIARASGTLTPAMTLSERLSRSVLALTADTREHPVGAVVADANPIADTAAVQILDDFRRVSSNPAAMRVFTESDAMRRVREHPAVREIVGTLSRDPEISAAIERGLDRRGIGTILQSDALLEAIDDSDAMHAIAPLMEDVRAALNEALDTMNENTPRP